MKLKGYTAPPDEGIAGVESAHRTPDLGLEAGRRFEVPMPLASITRDLVQSMMGSGMSEEDFSTLLLQQARASGLELKPENKPVGDGLSS